MNIIVRKSRARVDHPERHPGYSAAVEAGRRNLATGRMKFENEAEKRDYMRAVRSNPNNVPGLPTFYPPEQIRSFVTVSIDEQMTREKIQRRLDIECTKDVYLYCPNCRGAREASAVSRTTPHTITRTGSHCKICGAAKPFRLE